MAVNGKYWGSLYFIWKIESCNIYI